MEIIIKIKMLMTQMSITKLRSELVVNQSIALVVDQEKRGYKENLKYENG